MCVALATAATICNGRVHEKPLWNVCPSEQAPPQASAVGNFSS